MKPLVKDKFNYFWAAISVEKAPWTQILDLVMWPRDPPPLKEFDYPKKSKPLSTWFLKLLKHTSICASSL